MVLVNQTLWWMKHSGVLLLRFQYNMILHTSLRELGQNVNQRVNPWYAMGYLLWIVGENWPCYSSTILDIASAIRHDIPISAFTAIAWQNYFNGHERTWKLSFIIYKLTYVVWQNAPSLAKNKTWNDLLCTWNYFNPLRAKFIWGNINIYLHFMSLLHRYLNLFLK